MHLDLGLLDLAPLMQNADEWYITDRPLQAQAHQLD